MGIEKVIGKMRAEESTSYEPFKEILKFPCFHKAIRKKGNELN